MPHDDDCGTNYNGFCPKDIDKLVSVKNSSANTSMVDTKEEDLESSQELNSPPLNVESPESINYASATIDTSEILKWGLSGSENPTKAQHFPLDIKQNSEGSVGFANALMTLEIADGFAICGSSSDSRFVARSAFAAGTDSDNSEDRSSKSSRVASVPKVRYDLPEVLGHLRENNRTKNFSGKSSSNSVQKGQGKGQIESSKKPREERAKIEKENSHSSMESDSRSSYFCLCAGYFYCNY
ncbi:hypothetical protein I3843_11G205300 [Carya illinoinensis]|nr:hypothetical protein I3843_11G205300 [Carya illinoinensis]